jgi:hypothetical protein
MLGGALVMGLFAGACTASPSAGPNGGSSSPGTTTSSSSPRSGQSSSTTTTSPPVAAGVVADKSAVPWSALGPGWLLATWSPQATSVTGQGAAATLYLVDPAGGRYDLGPAPSGRLVDWSGDGTRALFLTNPPSGTATPSQIVVESLPTGAVQQFAPATGATVFEAEFSKPDGTAVLVGGAPVRRYGLTGALEESYPGSIPGAGAGSAASGGVVETPAGTTLVLQAASGLDVVTNGGAPVRFLPPPPGEDDCLLDGWWAGDAVLETCVDELYAQPVDGGTASVVAPNATGGQYLDAWTVSGEVVAEAGACGTTWLVKVGDDGTAHRVTLPGVANVVGIGTAANALAVLVTPSCDEPSGQKPHGNLLEWYTPSTGSLRTVLGGTLGGGTVDAAVAQDDR